MSAYRCGICLGELLRENAIRALKQWSEEYVMWVYHQDGSFDDETLDPCAARYEIHPYMKLDDIYESKE